MIGCGRALERWGGRGGGEIGGWEEVVPLPDGGDYLHLGADRQSGVGGPMWHPMGSGWVSGVGASGSGLLLREVPLGPLKDNLRYGSVHGWQRS